MSRIYWDSMLFIYWLDNNPIFAKRVASIYSRMEQRRDTLITSAVTFGEVLAGAYRKAPLSTGEDVRTTLLSVVSEVIPFTLETADAYARIRGSTNVASPDAIHLACAAVADTDLFLTNDRRLVGRAVPGIQFIAGLDSNIL
jgi:predicted nucleic acid-binding protein